MQVALFDFDLPPERIAQSPAEPRDSARLLDCRDGLTNRIVRDLPDLLEPGDLLVTNNTRVIPARLRGRKGEGKVELTLFKQVGPSTWKVFAKPARKLQPGVVIHFEDGLEAETINKGEGGEATLQFNLPDAELLAALHAQGEMPLPPYIKRGAGGEAADLERYQTVFAEREGAVAAPTAGLHFTSELLTRLAERGVGHAQVTLHVGAGTFLPVKVENTEDHVMHSEWGEIDEATVSQIRAAKRVIAVGTTSLRVLESAALGGELQPFSGETDIFITPGFDFKVVDVLLTNFHLPCSTLFMLISAFAGLEPMRAAYRHAIEQEYRFYSYGDACLLERT